MTRFAPDVRAFARAARAALLLAAVCLAGATGCSTHARPLELTFESTAAFVSGEQIGNPRGVGLRLAFDRVVFSASHGRDVGRRVTSPCAGLVFDPSPCVEQPVVQESEVDRLAVGYRWERSWASNRFQVVPWVGIASLRHEERGMHTGARRRGDGGGPQYGTTVTLQRNLFGGLWLGASLEAARISPVVLECADCYEPFTEGTELLGLSFAASYRLP